MILSGIDVNAIPIRSVDASRQACSDERFGRFGLPTKVRTKTMRRLLARTDARSLWLSGRMDAVRYCSIVSQPITRAAGITSEYAGNAVRLQPMFRLSMQREG